MIFPFSRSFLIIFVGLLNKLSCYVYCVCQFMLLFLVGYVMSCLLCKVLLCYVIFQCYGMLCHVMSVLCNVMPCCVALCYAWI